MYLKTQGLVLREVAYKDTDKLLTVLTRDYGKMTLKARGSAGPAAPEGVLPAAGLWRIYHF